jgi:hypothetical protein
MCCKETCSKCGREFGEDELYFRCYDSECPMKGKTILEMLEESLEEDRAEDYAITYVNEQWKDYPDMEKEKERILNIYFMEIKHIREMKKSIDTLAKFKFPGSLNLFKRTDEIEELTSYKDEKELAENAINVVNSTINKIIG